MSGLISKEERCIICGKYFDVIIDTDTGHILTDCFHNYLPTKYFFGWTYELLRIDDEDIKFKPRFKNNYYRIVGFCKWSRDIYYFLWKLFTKIPEFEYWECPECNNREDDI